MGPLGRVFGTTGGFIEGQAAAAGTYETFQQLELVHTQSKFRYKCRKSGYVLLVIRSEYTSYARTRSMRGTVCNFTCGK